eukprot:comp21800_c0_seq1/m.31002 comp21800_c0_seq1/g.31002  ORF comp21800_c0_seq1/g.31002 comp21800_c0_seq1/m.31002 type:complete len:202 (-) comp21800_c0_seq1:688-1293(-)
MDFLRNTFTGGGGGSTSRSGPGAPKEEAGLTYGQTFFVLYAPDGRRWTAKCEYEHVATRKSAHYARLVKQAKHERTDLCFAKVIEENRGILNRIVDAATSRDPNDLRVCYGDKVLLWGWVDGGKYLRATNLIGWMQFSQEVPDIGATLQGENVFTIHSADSNAKKGAQVKFGDSIILESCRYSGYSVSVQHGARVYYYLNV